ncbi:arginine catabolic regulator [Weissella viridescens]|uniref:Arginine repressor n=1 Tax=Weissella viridescens TaxID=1629 RepID=A0A3P2RH89_WEIVI|nr:arginine catabolic regulator [Weissella viridescens]RRG18876.1 arginine catabolic regulator [Weissella viridescens]
MKKNKAERQAAIRQLVETADIRRQEDLVDALNAEGWQVTQATISRDIAEMQLIKVPQNDGTFRYAVMESDSSLDQLKAILNETGTKVATQNNLVFIDVLPGSGPALKTAITAVNFQEVFGTMSDDASVLIVLKTDVKGADFMQQF